MNQGSSHKRFYLSQSGLKDYLHCTELYHLKRTDGHRQKGDFSGPREVGTAYDAYIKKMVSLYHGRKQADVLQELEHNLRDFNTMDHLRAREIGKRYAMQYKECGAFDELMEEGTIDGMDLTVRVGEAVAHVRLDALTVRGDPLDYKVNGAWSTRGQSPKQGYFKRWVKRHGIWVKEGPHKKAKEGSDPGPGMYLEDINWDWGFQIAFYHFALRHRPGEEMWGRIEQVAVRPKGPCFASFRAQISSEFQHYVYNALQKGYIDISDGLRPPVTFHDKKCFPYNRPCDVSAMCPVFQEAIARRGREMDEAPKGKIRFEGFKL